MNPALTIMANALRVGDHLLERLGAHADTPTAPLDRPALSELAVTRRAQLCRLARPGHCALSHGAGRGLLLTRRNGASARRRRLRGRRRRHDRRRTSIARSAFFTRRADVREGVRRRSDGRRLRAPRGRLRPASARRSHEARRRVDRADRVPGAAKAVRFRPTSRSNDRWFQHVAIIVSDMDQAYARLRAHKVEHASTGPQRLPDWNTNAGGIKAFYFKDPDGHALEILQFPPDKGDAEVASRPRTSSFSASTTRRSSSATPRRACASTATRSDLQWPARARTTGTEQEHLNNVFGARLRITACRAAPGPGIELLEYLAPRDGRPTPADTRERPARTGRRRWTSGGSRRPRLHADAERSRSSRPGVVALTESPWIPRGAAGPRSRRPQVRVVRQTK